LKVRRACLEYLDKTVAFQQPSELDGLKSLKAAQMAQPMRLTESDRFSLGELQATMDDSTASSWTLEQVYSRARQCHMRLAQLSEERILVEQVQKLADQRGVLADRHEVEIQRAKDERDSLSDQLSQARRDSAARIERSAHDQAMENLRRELEEGYSGRAEESERQQSRAIQTIRENFDEQEVRSVRRPMPIE